MEDLLATFLKTVDTEFEIRFGTQHTTPITKIQMNNVVKKLKSLGFSSYTSRYMLKIQHEFLDRNTGRTMMSNVRTEIAGISDIKKYCESNRIIDENGDVFPNIYFEKKAGLKKEGIYIKPVDYRDLNFRASIQEEKKLDHRDVMVKSTVSNWNNSKKTFRFMKRSTFRHEKYGFNVDISIVKTSKSTGRHKMIPEYLFIDSDCLNSQETYEIEIEALRIPEPTMPDLKKCIKIILSGLQSSNFPIGFSEINSVRQEYYNLVNKSKPTRRLYPKDFIGPSSISLELAHIQNDSENNVLTDFVVTDKADGQRKLLYVSDSGKVYFIDMNLNIQFTGITTPKYHNTIIDGEHIIHNKRKDYYNLYAAFDIYFLENQDLRMLPFIDRKQKCRLNHLTTIGKDIIDSGTILQFSVKTFYDNENIFNSCKLILEKDSSGLFEYELDGLIFTSKSLGVGQNKPGDKISNTKKTWLRSFKWKPPEFNTIDFLVTTKKDKTAIDEISNMFESGISTKYGETINKYKTLILRVGFDESKHGFLNPFDMVINNVQINRSQLDNNENYKPLPFYPTDPYDSNANKCKIVLDRDNNMLIEDNSDKIEDNTIVEFRYDDSKTAGFKWIPIRVRHDKTAELRAGQKNYGNAYHVAQSVWQSIHNPIVRDTIMSGLGIPDIINYKYYNSKTETKRYAIRDFHNLGIKRRLIKSTTKPGSTLLDVSVGKGGDIPKWVNSSLGFVVGIDVNRDNIENRIDGACARYLKMKQKNKSTPLGIFLNGNSELNIKTGVAFSDEKHKNIMKSLLGNGPKDKHKIGSVVYDNYGRFKDGFDVVSCQFSIHYFFKNKVTLSGFLKNISDMCKVNGYFIGTCYDGKRLFKLLQDINRGECISKHVNNKKMCEIIKDYERDEFNDDSSSLGYAIKVYQESINDSFTEYLVNFDYLTMELEKYGFKLLTVSELKQINLPSSVTSFKTIFEEIQQKTQINKSLIKNYGNSIKLNKDEQFISFLNNMFVFKKIEVVTVDPGVIEPENVFGETETPVKPLHDEKKPLKKKKKKKKLGKVVMLDDEETN
jgi:hypothetical protein